MKTSDLRAFLKFVTFLVLTGSLLLVYLVLYPTGHQQRRRVAKLFFKGCVRLTGLDIQIEGKPSKVAGTLFLANHVSYLDIVALASLIDARFVAKADVRDWPLFGFLARISQTLFVSRSAARVAKERLVVADSLRQGHSVILFPEGSSSDGTSVLPFRPGLTSAAFARPGFATVVQPVSLVYGPSSPTIGPVSRSLRDQYAWYGDMEMLPHLWQLFGLSQSMKVVIRFHESQVSPVFPDSRALAKWAETQVRTDIHEKIHGSPVCKKAAPSYA